MMAENEGENSGQANESPESTEHISLDDVDQEVIMETGPVLRPVLALVGTIIGVAGVIIAVLVSDPDLVGDPSFAEIIINAIIILVAILLLRYVVKIVVLNRTVYTIHEGGFKREYDLIYREYSRELPVEQLRGKEYDRGRYQALFRCATIRLLTGGTDRSLGFIEFESVPNPDKVNRTIEMVRQRHESGS